jgi:hypothetical protein
MKIRSNSARVDGSTKADTNSPARLTREVQAKLGEQLRQMYNDVISQGVPDRFADLLEKLDQNHAVEGDKAGDESRSEPS